MSFGISELYHNLAIMLVVDEEVSKKGAPISSGAQKVSYVNIWAFVFTSLTLTFTSQTTSPTVHAIRKTRPIASSLLVIDKQTVERKRARHALDSKSESRTRSHGSSLESCWQGQRSSWLSKCTRMRRTRAPRLWVRDEYFCRARVATSNL